MMIRGLCMVLVLGMAWSWTGYQAPKLFRERLILQRGAAAEIKTAPRDLHEIGFNFKTRGLEYRDKVKTASRKRNKMGFAALATLNFAVFTMYRAYRGFFVILPAVFIEVRNKLERKEITSLEVAEDIDPKTGKLKLRSTILMNLGAAIFTAVIVLRTAIFGIFSLFNRPREGDNASSLRNDDVQASTNSAAL
mmetsp:Transcript_9025/g.13891  ORF Transcript_9025/g.13891 Transcript_9025/m.13891 type:complete len:193 (-) Transcript_9025:1086-1664(-)